MARLPADEDYARALLSVFQSKNIAPRQSLRRAEAKAAFLARNFGREDDFEAALSYAVSQGWLWSGLDMLRLLGPGDEEMQTIWPGRDDWSETARHRPQRLSLSLLKSRFWREAGAVKRARAKINDMEG